MADGGEDEARERYRELLEELRTVLPGVQVLLGFLMMVPFNQRFADPDHAGLLLFAGALGGAALATVLLLAPASFHRLTRLGGGAAHRQRRLRFSVRVTVVGLAVLLAAIVCALALVLRFVFGTTIGTLVAGACAAVAAVTWYLVPLLVRRRDEADATR